MNATALLQQNQLGLVGSAEADQPPLTAAMRENLSPSSARVPHITKA